jgi:hypothetical protein
MYYGRHFRSADGSVPPLFGPLLQPCGSVSALTLPADNGTWGVALITSAKDAALRGLRDADRWTAALRSFPLQAHWLDGEPLDDQVIVMAKIEDRIRSYWVDGAPVATGVVAVADSWACTNPSLGRGVSMGLVHGLALRDLVRTQPLDDPTAFALAWQDVTDRTVVPWYRDTLHLDRHRLAEVEAAVDDRPYEPGDAGWERFQAAAFATGQDPEILRGFLEVMAVLRPVDDVFADPGFADRVAAAGAGWREAPTMGPSRGELLGIAGGAQIGR